MGQVTDVVEVEMEDGTVHILPEYLKMETDLGAKTVREALAEGAEIKQWWLESAREDLTAEPCCDIVGHSRHTQEWSK